MYKTIRQTSRELKFPEHLIRTMVKQGVCPGIYSGNRFLVNVEMFVEQLDAESCRNIKTGAVTA